MTESEQGYVAQGYALPDGWDWDEVAAQRTQWDIGAIYVPVAGVSGIVCWGVPMTTDGKFFSHP